MTRVRHGLLLRSAPVMVKDRCRVTTTCARLHIDLQRVTTALCPASDDALAPRTAARHAAA
ncbi:hypothetical protein [Streptacidiphilus monticola]|uniref:Uncharacterized protein n=1 Tax=Streptacidiphilus monticola TaxID=2161674 RepID=A0ABW1G082_9ACTN